MNVMENRPELNVHSGYEADLRVERTEISFRDVAEDIVLVQVTVSNAGALRSEPTIMRLESAPLGAFVPWQPLARLRVPALEPGESRKLSTEVARPRTASLGDFNRVPPKRLLTAVNASDQASPPRLGVMAMVNLLRRGQLTRSSGGELVARRSLVPDLWDLLGRGQQHWAGNINVFVGSRAVERHLARALRIYPGRTNLAMFIVGSPGKRESFAFELVGLSPGWKAALFDATSHASLVVDPSDAPIEETRWVETNGGLVAMLATQPPAGCSTGNLEVHVTRQTPRKTAIVEFNLDPAAQGAGCYCV